MTMMILLLLVSHLKTKNLTLINNQTKVNDKLKQNMCFL